MTASNPRIGKLINTIKNSGVAPKGTSMSKEGNGLWANIWAKRRRGEKMRKKGEKGAPTADQIKRAQGEAVSPAQQAAIAISKKERGEKPKVNELSMSARDIKKSGLRKTTDTEKLKKELEQLKKLLKQKNIKIRTEAFMSRRPGNQMADLYKLYTLAIKAMPGSPKQKERKKKIAALRKELKLDEKLGKDADAGDYIDDFKKSDAPQFKGKSDKKKKDMAIAAYLDAKEKGKIKEDVPANNTGSIPNPADTVMGPRKKKKKHTQLIHDKRYKNKHEQPVLLKRFRDYYDAKGIGG